MLQSLAFLPLLLLLPQSVLADGTRVDLNGAWSSGTGRLIWDTTPEQDFFCAQGVLSIYQSADSLQLSLVEAHCGRAEGADQLVYAQSAVSFELRGDAIYSSGQRVGIVTADSVRIEETDPTRPGVRALTVLEKRADGKLRYETTVTYEDSPSELFELVFGSRAH